MFLEGKIFEILYGASIKSLESFNNAYSIILLYFDPLSEISQKINKNLMKTKKIIDFKNILNEKNLNFNEKDLSIPLSPLFPIKKIDFNIEKSTRTPQNSRKSLSLEKLNFQKKNLENPYFSIKKPGFSETSNFSLKIRRLSNPLLHSFLTDRTRASLKEFKDIKKQRKKTWADEKIFSNEKKNENIEFSMYFIRKNMNFSAKTKETNLILPFFDRKLTENIILTDRSEKKEELFKNITNNKNLLMKKSANCIGNYFLKYLENKKIKHKIVEEKIKNLKNLQKEDKIFVPNFCLLEKNNKIDSHSENSEMSLSKKKPNHLKLIISKNINLYSLMLQQENSFFSLKQDFKSFVINFQRKINGFFCLKIEKTIILSNFNDNFYRINYFLDDFVNFYIDIQYNKLDNEELDYVFLHKLLSLKLKEKKKEFSFQNCRENHILFIENNEKNNNFFLNYAIILSEILNFTEKKQKINGKILVFSEKNNFFDEKNLKKWKKKIKEKICKIDGMKNLIWEKLGRIKFIKNENICEKYEKFFKNFGFLQNFQRITGKKAKSDKNIEFKNIFEKKILQKNDLKLLKIQETKKKMEKKPEFLMKNNEILLIFLIKNQIKQYKIKVIFTHFEGKVFLLNIEEYLFDSKIPLKHFLEIPINFNLTAFYNNNFNLNKKKLLLSLINPITKTKFTNSKINSLVIKPEKMEKILIKQLIYLNFKAIYWKIQRKDNFLYISLYYPLLRQFYYLKILFFNDFCSFLYRENVNCKSKNLIFQYYFIKKLNWNGKKLLFNKKLLKNQEKSIWILEKERFLSNLFEKKSFFELFFIRGLGKCYLKINIYKGVLAKTLKMSCFCLIKLRPVNSRFKCYQLAFIKADLVGENRDLLEKINFFLRKITFFKEINGYVPTIPLEKGIFLRNSIKRISEKKDFFSINLEIFSFKYQGIFSFKGIFIILTARFHNLNDYFELELYFSRTSRRFIIRIPKQLFKNMSFSILKSKIRILSTYNKKYIVKIGNFRGILREKIWEKHWRTNLGKKIGVECTLVSTFNENPLKKWNFDTKFDCKIYYKIIDYEMKIIKSFQLKIKELLNKRKMENYCKYNDLINFCRNISEESENQDIFIEKIPNLQFNLFVLADEKNLKNLNLLNFQTFSNFCQNKLIFRSILTLKPKKLLGIFWNKSCKKFIFLIENISYGNKKIRILKYSIILKNNPFCRYLLKEKNYLELGNLLFKKFKNKLIIESI